MRSRDCLGGGKGWSAEGKTLVPVLCGHDEKPVGRHQRVLEQALPGWRWLWTQGGPPLAAEVSVTGLEAEQQGYLDRS